MIPSLGSVWEHYQTGERISVLAIDRRTDPAGIIDPLIWYQKLGNGKKTVMSYQTFCNTYTGPKEAA